MPQQQSWGEAGTRKECIFCNDFDGSMIHLGKLLGGKLCCATTYSSYLCVPSVGMNMVDACPLSYRSIEDIFTQESTFQQWRSPRESGYFATQLSRARHTSHKLSGASKRGQHQRRAMLAESSKNGFKISTSAPRLWSPPPVLQF